MTEDDIVVGNAYDKYGSKNPIVRWMMNGFEHSLSSLVDRVEAKEIHEVGCGEGYWVMQWKQQGLLARGSDFSSQVIELAGHNAREQGLSADLFQQRSIYQLVPDLDAAELVVCCEVLEHLEQPEQGLLALQRIVQQHVILSVPREPLWRVLNVARGKYLSELGNTPGHLQHWSKASFIGLVSQYFDVIKVETPLPWIMLLCRAKKNRKKEHG